MLSVYKVKYSMSFYPFNPKYHVKDGKPKQDAGAMLIAASHQRWQFALIEAILRNSKV